MKETKVDQFNKDSDTSNEFQVTDGLRNSNTRTAYIHLAGELASADLDAAQNFQTELAKIIEEGGYVPHQTFNTLSTVWHTGMWSY